MDGRNISSISTVAEKLYNAPGGKRREFAERSHDTNGSGINSFAMGSIVT